MKKFIAGLICGAALMLTSSVFADDAIQQITAYLSTDITVEIDGQKVELEKAPVNYDKSIYLPVRELAGIVGLAVDWDDETRTAKLSRGGSVDDPTIIETTFNGYEAIEIEGTIYFRFATSFLDDYPHLAFGVDYDKGVISIDGRVADMSDINDYYIFKDKAYLNAKFFPESD